MGAIPCTILIFVYHDSSYPGVLQHALGTAFVIEPFPPAHLYMMAYLNDGNL